MLFSPFVANLRNCSTKKHRGIFIVQGIERSHFRYGFVLFTIGNKNEQILKRKGGSTDGSNDSQESVGGGLTGAVALHGGSSA